MTKSALVIVAWPDMLTRTFGCWYDAPLRLLGLQVADAFYRTGHVAALLVSTATGRVHYVDFGRYASSQHLGRVRDEESDPVLAVPVQARLRRGSQIANLGEILRALASIPAVQAEGRIEAAVLHGVDFDAAYRLAKELQSRGLLQYGNFRPGALNCVRFVLRLAGRARSDFASRLRIFALRLLNPCPYLLVRLLNDLGSVVAYQESSMTKRQPTPDEARGIGTFHEPPRPVGLPTDARWLACVSAAGSWVTLKREVGRRYRLRRFLASGRLECERLFRLDRGALDLAKPHRFEHPTHGLACTLRQKGRHVALRPIALGR